MVSDAIKYLYDLELFGIKLGLENISNLCRLLGNPQNKFPSIHIAGTNGKGSTAAILESILLAAGYRVGLYTSPHLVRFNERIRVNRQEIPDRFIEEFVVQIKPEIERLKATFFEATTAMAFQYFAEQKVDVAVVETGLGGRLDATNILTPVVSIITGIDKDHTDRLGKSYSQIAAEKAGIIKPGVPVVTGFLMEPATGVIKRAALAKKAPLISSQIKTRAEPMEESFRGSWFRVPQRFVSDHPTAKRRTKEIFLSLAGYIQKTNLSSALAAVDVLRQKGFAVPASACVKGAKSVFWPARMELISENPPVVLDVAHNPAAAGCLSVSIDFLWEGKTVFLLGLLADKDYRAFVGSLNRLATKYYFVRPDSKRALEPEVLAEAVGKNKPCEVVADPVKAFWKAYTFLEPDELLVVTGSHYVVGKILEGWQASGRPYPFAPTREQESVILG